MRKDLRVNIAFFIVAMAAAYTSCAINVHVPRPLLTKQFVFCIVEASKRLIN